MTTRDETAKPSPWKSPRVRWLTLILGGFLILGAAYGVYWDRDLRYTVYTDDAYVSGNVVEITPRVSGTVVAIGADNTQFVRAGQTMVRLDPADAKVLMAGIRAVRSLVEAPALKHLIVRETRPGPDVQTEEQIAEYIRATTQTTWHVVGSCRMGDDAMAVVDSSLKVRGLEGLRVIDSSVFPTIPSSNTNAPTIALGERGADIVLRAWNSTATLGKVA